MSLEYLSKLNNEKRTTNIVDNVEGMIANELQLYNLSHQKDSHEVGMTTSQLITHFALREITKYNGRVHNADKLLTYLQSIRNFIQFLLISNISYTTIEQTFSQASYISLKQNDILFHKGDKSDLFYLIISGVVSLQVPITNQSDERREINSLSEGQFFGEWGLIYHIRRTLTAVAQTDVILLSFNKTVFQESFSKSLIRAEIDRKVLICQKLPPFMRLSHVQFNQYFREIKKVFPSANEMIYAEETSATAFYLIYKGNCCIRTKENNGANLIIHDKGSLIGLESLVRNGKYKHSLYANSTNTILLKFIVSDYLEPFIEELRDSLRRLMNIQNNITSNYLEMHQVIKEKSEKTRNSRSIENHLFTIQPKTPLSQIVQFHIKEYKPEGMNLKVSHNFLQKNKKEKTLLIHQSQELQHNQITSFNQSQSNCIDEGTMTMSFTKTINILKPSSKKHTLPKISLRKKPLITKESSNATPEAKTPQSHLTINSHYSNRFNQSNLASTHYPKHHISKSLFSQDYNSSNQQTTITMNNNQESSFDNQDKSIYPSTSITKTNFYIKYSPLCINGIIDQDNTFQDKKAKEKMTLKQKVDNSIAMWKSSLLNKDCKFTTKRFKLPLYVNVVKSKGI